MVCSAAITFQCPIYHCPLSFSPFLCLIASYTGNCCVVCHCESPSVYSNQTKSEQQLYRRVGERSAPIDACHVTAVRGPSWPDALTVLGNRNSSVLKAREKRFIIAISGERERDRDRERNSSKCWCAFGQVVTLASSSLSPSFTLSIFDVDQSG